MRRMLKTMMLTGTALAMLAAAPARSVEAVNGINPNGINPNGINPNGINPNGINPNGINPNGINPNGINPNGINPNGINPNGINPNGLSLHGLAGSEHAANSVGGIGRVIAVELPRRSGTGISVWPALP